MSGFNFKMLAVLVIAASMGSPKDSMAVTGDLSVLTDDQKTLNSSNVHHIQEEDENDAEIRSDSSRARHSELGSQKTSKAKNIGAFKLEDRELSEASKTDYSSKSKYSKSKKMDYSLESKETDYSLSKLYVDSEDWDNLSERSDFSSSSRDMHSDLGSRDSSIEIDNNSNHSNQSAPLLDAKNNLNESRKRSNSA